ncbi:hypothetical protein [Iningainema tapete]|uniref:Uncharacterized protein n=1 Tax=Iningainema tapete BLCC-T55 TaxID=2748662 RepID=A0A8J6XQK0_9CYAN|nr:hypothetical protein [Iningainema tapete]MBD2777717.1 hypothetical protein [Iningainema tapete BLCC-T55]
MNCWFVFDKQTTQNTSNVRISYGLKATLLLSRACSPQERSGVWLRSEDGALVRMPQ